MNQHIKEMGIEYKKQRGNRGDDNKIETLEEEIEFVINPSIYSQI